MHRDAYSLVSHPKAVQSLDVVYAIFTETVDPFFGVDGRETFKAEPMTLCLSPSAYCRNGTS
jgi:hypothetical protein